MNKPDSIFKQERTKYNQFDQLPEEMYNEVKARMEKFPRNEIKLFRMPRNNQHRMKVEKMVSKGAGHERVLTATDRTMGNLKIQARWNVTLEIDGDTFSMPFAFISKINPDGKPSFAPPTVDGSGYFRLNGAKQEDREIYKALLLFPFFKHSIFSEDYAKKMNFTQTIDEVNYHAGTEMAINDVDRVIARASFLDTLAKEQLDILQKQFNVSSHEKVKGNVKLYIKNYTNAQWSAFLEKLTIDTFAEAFSLASKEFISIEKNVVTTKTGKSYTIPIDFHNITDVKERIAAWVMNPQTGKEFRTQIINEYLSGQYSTKKGK